MDIDVSVTATYESLKDRVFIITGGGQGIGRGYAHHFAAQGAIPRDRRDQRRERSQRPARGREKGRAARWR